MLLMRPRRLERSRYTSCSTPFSTTAARASWVFALIRISVLMGRCSRDTRVPRHAPSRHACRVQELGRLEQRQAHHAGKAAAQLGHEDGPEALNGVAAGLVR